MSDNLQRETERHEFEGEPGASSVARRRREGRRRGVNLLSFLLRGRLRDVSGLVLIFLGLMAIVAVVLVLVALIAYVVQRSGDTVRFATTSTPTSTRVSPAPSATATSIAIPTATLQATVSPPVASHTPTRGTQLSPGIVAEVFDTGDLGLRLREGPGLEHETAGIVEEGSLLDVLEGPVRADELVWWRVQTTDLVAGWAASDYLRPADVDIGEED